MGNGRTGTFFSFEPSGLNPDIITLSKSIGGGLPLSLVLMKPELDQWRPGEHTGTFRGNNLAFVAAAEMLSYWSNDNLTEAVRYKEQVLKDELDKIATKYPELNAEVRGKGLIYGLKIPSLGFCDEISAEAFNRGLVIELAGAEDDVLKFLPPLVIDEEVLRAGLTIIDESIGILLQQKDAMKKGGEG